MSAQMRPLLAENFLLFLYEKAFDLFQALIEVMQFPCLTQGNSRPEWHEIWIAAKGCFDLLKDITIPIATIFFIIAIYKTVISKPPEEQPKQFLVEALRFIMILFIAGNLFTILSLITEFSENLTNAVLNLCGGTKIENSKFWTDGLATIKNAIVENEKNGNPKFSELIEGDIVVFCEKIFVFLSYFLGGLVTLLVFGSSGFSIVMATIHRIIKPLIMIPFSTIVVGLGACSGEGERMMWHYAKSFLGYCMSGVFILMAVKMGLSLASLDLFNLSEVVKNPTTEGDRLMAALVALFRVNLPVVITSGLVKSADSFMEKIFS